DPIDFARVHLNPATIRAGIRIAGGSVSVTLKNITARSEHPSFTLHELSGAFTLTPTSTVVTDLRIRTEGSDIRINTRLDGIDLLSTGDLAEFEHAQVRLDLDAPRITLRELRQFLPEPLEFLDREAALKVRGSGTFAALQVEQLELKTPRSFIRLAGTISNLQAPESLELDVSSKDALIHPEDALDLLPGLHLPDFRSMGLLDADLTFRGTPEFFKAGVTARTQYGEALASAELDLRGEEMIYDADLTTRNLDPGRIFDNDHLAGNLNLNVAIAGVGTSPESMTTLVRAEIDSSTLYGLPVGHSVAVFDISDRLLRMHLFLNYGFTSTDLTGTLRFNRNRTHSYTLGGRINSLNLADIVRDPHFESDLNVAIRAEGTGHDLSSMNTSMSFDLSRSRFGSRDIGNTDIHLAYHGSDSLSRSLVIGTEAATCTLEGKMTPAGVITALTRGGEILVSSIENRLAHLDSFPVSSPGRMYTGSSATQGEFVSDNLDVRYTIDVLDLVPLGVILDTPLQGRIVVTGGFAALESVLSLSGIAEIPWISLGSEHPGFELGEARVEFALDDIRETGTLESLQASVLLRSNTAAIGATPLTGVLVEATLVRDSTNFSAAGLIDSTVGVNLHGTALFRSGTYEILLPTSTLTLGEVT
ncbi:MAG: hypothetical protein WD295_06170, partial [Bacteroidota bacterium]